MLHMKEIEAEHEKCDGVDFFFSSGSIYTKLNHFGMSLTEAGVLT